MGSLVTARGLLSCVMRTLTCSTHVGSSFLTRDRTRAPCIGSVESYPLRHQGSPPSVFLTLCPILASCSLWLLSPGWWERGLWLLPRTSVSLSELKVSCLSLYPASSLRPGLSNWLKNEKDWSGPYTCLLFPVAQHPQDTAWWHLSGPAVKTPKQTCPGWSLHQVGPC